MAGALAWTVFFLQWLKQADQAIFVPQGLLWGILPLILLTLLFSAYLGWVQVLLKQLPLARAIQRGLLALTGGLILWPALGLVTMPFLISAGSRLNLDVLGHLSIPFTFGIITLMPGTYVALLWLGPSWIGLLLIAFGLAGSKRLFLGGPSSLPQARWLLTAGMLLYLLMGLWTTLVYPPTGDEPHYLMISQSLWQDHDLDLTNQMVRASFRQFYPVEHLDFHHTPTPSGQLISKHFPLLSLLMSPLVALAGRFGAVMLIMASASLLAVLLRALAMLWTNDYHTADLVWLLVLVTVPLGIYFDLIFTELPAMAVFLTGLLAFYKGRGRWSWLLLAAACLLPWFYPKYIPLSLVLGILLVVSLRKHPWQLVIMMAPAVLTAAAYTIFYRHFYGLTVSQNPYGAFHPLLSWRGLGNALGLLVDRDFGLVPSAPMLVLAVAGLRQLKSLKASAFWIILAVGAAEFLLYSLFDDFTGSAAICSRNFLPAPVVLLIPAVMGLKQWWLAGGWKKTASLILLFLTTAQVWLCAAWPMLRYLAPKIKLYAMIGFSPSLFPSLADGMTAGEMVWAAAGCMVIMAALAQAEWSVFFRKNKPDGLDPGQPL